MAEPAQPTLIVNSVKLSVGLRESPKAGNT